MNNDSCTCCRPSEETCLNDIGLAAGIGVLVAGLLILLTFLIFYYCYRKSHPCVEKLLGVRQQQRATSSHKHFSGNYFVDANDSYLLESGKPPVDFNYFHEGKERENAMPLEASEIATPVGTAHRQLQGQRSQTSAALLQDIGTSSNFSPDLGDRANFPIIAGNEIPVSAVESTLSLRSNTTLAAMDLSFWPSMPSESAVDLRPPVLTARVGLQGGGFTSEAMHVTLSAPSNAYTKAVTMTVGTSSRPEDQPELDQSSSLVTSVYSCSPSVGESGACRLRVPLSCHLMDMDDGEESAYDTLPEVSNLIVMINKSEGDSESSEWTDVGAILDFIESTEESRRSGHAPAGYVEFDVEGSALYTVRCDSGIWVKSMCLSHFAAALDEDQTWTLRVFLHRDKTEDYERICQYAKEFNMMPVGMPQPFHLPQHSYVHVLVSSITEGCALESSTHGVLHGEGCWPNVEQPPYVEYRLRQVHGCLPLPLIRVRMDVVVADDFDNITFELLSQWSTQAQMKMDKKMPDALSSKGTHSDPWPWTLVSPWQQLSSAQVKQMSSILDRPLMGDQDYSTLAALLGYTEEQVNFFSLQRPSQTEALLKDLHTRLPVMRVTDRLLVALGRMGAVWLSDFLRQACRVDRVQQKFEDAESSFGDTLPRRAASGIYSSIRRTLNGTLKLTEEEKNDSFGHYQRRVVRMSGRKLATNRRTSTTGSASVAIYANATMARPAPMSAPPAVGEQQQQSPQSPWSKPLLNQMSSASSENMTDGATDETGPDDVLSAEHSNLELTSSTNTSSSRKLLRRDMSTTALYSSTKMVVEKHGRLAQVLGETGPTSQVYTVHHDPTAPHRAILQPAPYITNRPHVSSLYESVEHTDGGPGDQNSFVHRVARKLTRTSSMPPTQRNEKRKAKRRPISNDVMEDSHSRDQTLTSITSSQACLTPAEPGKRKKMSPYEEHIVPLPRKESLKPRPLNQGSPR